MIVNKALFNWSGGKDSALALYHTLRNPEFEVDCLMTSMNSEADRISMHGVRKSMLEEQVKAIGLPLSILSLPGEISMEDYDALMRKQMAGFIDQGITHSVFGDIFLEDLKKYREQRLEEVGLKGYFPLWKRDTRELIKEFLDKGFKTMVVSVDGSKLDKSFAGRELNESFLNDLPSNVDPCGENGEFHTFVFEGPIFKKPFSFEKGEVVGKEYKLSGKTNEKVTYWFQDLF
ncbi:MAG: diphthine--ammonia ligase [Roseivirga sp.]